MSCLLSRFSTFSHLLLLWDPGKAAEGGREEDGGKKSGLWRVAATASIARRLLQMKCSRDATIGLNLQGHTFLLSFFFNAFILRNNIQSELNTHSYGAKERIRTPTLFHLVPARRALWMCVVVVIAQINFHFILRVRPSVAGPAIPKGKWPALHLEKEARD
jgi:hypothetical protein